MKIMDRLLTVLAWCCLVAAANGAAPQTNSTPALAFAPQRFLFVVDTSQSMKKIDAAARQALFDLVFSGVNGHMRNGDTFGLWTFSEQLNAGRFPMQTWDSQDAMLLATTATKFLHAQKFEGKSYPAVAVAKINSVIRQARDVNVILITDGSAPVQGTLFDAVINADYESKGRERAKAKKPFVTVLLGRDGCLTNAFVRIAGETFPLPQPPFAPITAQKRVSPKTNAAPMMTVRVVTNRPGAVRIGTNSLIIRKAEQTTAVPSTAPTTGARASTQEPGKEPLVHPADLIGSSEAIAQAAPKTVPVAASRPPTKAGSPVQPPVEEATNVSAQSAALTDVLPPTPVAARQFDSRAARRGLWFHPLVMIGSGCVLLIGVAVVTSFAVRKARDGSRGPSLISRSMER